jgi:hypothetical protein
MIRPNLQMFTLLKTIKPQTARRHFWSNNANWVNKLPKNGLNIKLRANKIDSVSIYAYNLQGGEYRTPRISIRITYLQSDDTKVTVEHSGSNIEEIIQKAIDDFNESKN